MRMYELAQMFPTPDALLALEPDALGAKILAMLCRRGPNQDQGMFNLSNFIGDLWPYPTMPGYQSPFPQSKRPEIDLAIGEAWAWLEREGLLVPAPDLIRYVEGCSYSAGSNTATAQFGN